MSKRGMSECFIKQGVSEEAFKEISDGCSGGISWFYRKFLHREAEYTFCCNLHDFAYEEGGTSSDRAFYDREFLACMVNAGSPKMGMLFYFVVRIFGVFFWNNKK